MKTTIRALLFLIPYLLVFPEASFAQGGKVRKQIRKGIVIENGFSAYPSPPAPEYSLMDNWAAHPDKKDPSDEVPKSLVNPKNLPAADVFFIHPTSFTGNSGDSFRWNADVRNVKINGETDKGAIRFQASIFNAHFRVFAPRYRQAHYFSFLTHNLSDKKKALDLAYSDVRKAFLYYLEHHRNGRPFVIAAHSQGTIHAHRILREFVEGKPLQQDLVCAYLPGMPVPADSFTLLIPCKDSSDFGCWTSWRTWRYGYEPTKFTAVCHNPVSWTTDTIQVEKSKHKGAVLRDFKKTRPHLCDAKVHNGILWVHRPHFPGSRLIKNPNYHIGDYNLFYLDVRENAGLRLESFLNKNTVQKTTNSAPK
ncbi:MAG: DUF3089 domain-containing protein [Bacteroidetes bacterium]|jgi:Protein of unknown function (DUF3089)|nr:DUF3089 domain-containing protein [Bacteroidota bacterium]